MSFQAIDDINNSVAIKIQDFRRKNTQISLPTATKSQLDRITEDSRRYMADFGRINLETKGHPGHVPRPLVATCSRIHKQESQP